MRTGVLSDLNYSELRERYTRAQPIPFVVIDGFLEAGFANECAKAFPLPEQVRALGSTFTNLNERGKFQIEDSRLFPAPLKLLEDCLNGPEFIEAVEKITGIEHLLPDISLVGGGLHSTGAGGHLDVHLDFNILQQRALHRRLNIIVYFNDGWQKDWGGQLELWNHDVTVCEHRILPILNRCVIFETNEMSFHGVSAVYSPGHVARRSFAAYYYTEAAPPHFPGFAHNTIFKARPNERVKSVLMPIESKAKGLLLHLRSKFRFLRK